MPAGLRALNAGPFGLATDAGKLRSGAATARDGPDTVVEIEIDQAVGTRTRGRAAENSYPACRTVGFGGARRRLSTSTG
jgi:hypothetical protein